MTLRIRHPNGRFAKHPEWLVAFSEMDWRSCPWTFSAEEVEPEWEPLWDRFAAWIRRKVRG